MFTATMFSRRRKSALWKDAPDPSPLLRSPNDDSPESHLLWSICDSRFQGFPFIRDFPLQGISLCDGFPFAWDTSCQTPVSPAQAALEAQVEALNEKLSHETKRRSTEHGYPCKHSYRCHNLSAQLKPSPSAMSAVLVLPMPRPEVFTWLARNIRKVYM